VAAGYAMTIPQPGLWLVSLLVLATGKYRAILITNGWQQRHAQVMLRAFMLACKWNVGGLSTFSESNFNYLASHKSICILVCALCRKTEKPSPGQLHASRGPRISPLDRPINCNRVQVILESWPYHTVCNLYARQGIKIRPKLQVKTLELHP